MKDSKGLIIRPLWNDLALVWSGSRRVYLMAGDEILEQHNIAYAKPTAKTAAALMDSIETRLMKAASAMVLA